ncbi:prevent-host-death family protein [Dictyocaulus viviparus]|uniref:Prevent-host-death family protein n=1 Tax=Dictyocaulus viviparus TaxID=29172 RepID=A0A0D8XJJ7_DICVI|nr:prevent-host-death family protein [Dictyocaulus viviparus]
MCKCPGRPAVRWPDMFQANGMLYSQLSTITERAPPVSSFSGVEEIGCVSPTLKLESDEKTAELKTELSRAQQAEEQMRARTLRVISQLQDAEMELKNVRARNETLEKKQRRYDTDIRAVENQLREMKDCRDRAEKERDELKVIMSRRAKEIQESKTTISELRVKLARLQREAEERKDSVNGKDDLAVLQKEKGELTEKLREQEKELDDLACTNQQLLQKITCLEMGAERLKSNLTYESTLKESEVDEIRGQYHRKLRVLEDQLADLQDANLALSKENRVLEVKTRQYELNMQSSNFSGSQGRRELKKALALDQLEDAVAAKVGALKSRHSLESEINEIRMQLEQALVAKSASEDRALILIKEINSSAALIEEKDEQYQQLMRKYKAAIQNAHLDHIAIADYIEQVSDINR